MSTLCAVDEAILARLQADATLAALAPGGVWLDLAPDHVIDVHVAVTLQSEETVYRQGGAAYRVTRLQVKAVGRTTDSAAVKAAADRCLALLEDAAIAIPDHTLMISQRAADAGRFVITERDGPYLWRQVGFDLEVWTS